MGNSSPIKRAVVSTLSTENELKKQIPSITENGEENKLESHLLRVAALKCLLL